MVEATPWRGRTFLRHIHPCGNDVLSVVINAVVIVSSCHFSSILKIFKYLRNYLANKRQQVSILIIIALSMLWVLRKYRLNLSKKGREHLEVFFFIRIINGMECL